MGNRGHGTYAQLYQDVWTHRKTYRLAAALVVLGVPEAYARREAVGQLHELLCWGIATSDDGQVGHLPADEFARIVGWKGPPRSCQALLNAWLDSGFLDVIGPGDVQIHDLREAAKELFRKRDERRTTVARSPDAVRTTGGQRADNVPPPGGPRARVRIGSGNVSLSPTSLSGEPAVADPEGVERESASPSAPAPPQRSPAAVPVADPALADAWDAARAAKGLGPAVRTSELAAALAGLRRAVGADSIRGAAIVRAYFRSDDDAAVRCGWSPALFPHRLDGLLAEVGKAAARAAPSPPVEVVTDALPADAAQAEVAGIVAKLRKANA